MDGRAYRRRGTKPFRFEAMWIGDNDCSNIIGQVWSEHEGGTAIERALQLNAICGAKLQQWNKTKFGKVHQRLREANMQLQ